VSLPTAVLDRFHAALPRVRQWIEHTLERSEPQAVPVSSLGLPRLARHYPLGLLRTTKAVHVPSTPIPPLGRLGLDELVEMERRSFAAITFRDRVFVVPSEASESLYFHELVHVVQWARLGVERFLWVYGLGLLEHGYRQSPLERMAYRLERGYQRGEVPRDLMAEIEEQTDALWAQVAPRLGGAL